MASVTRVAVAFTVVIALNAAGCGGGPPAVEAEAPPAAAPVTTLAPADAEQAATLYAAQACAMCHGDQAEGGENGPELAGLDPYWNVERLATYLEDPDEFRKANPDFDQRRSIDYEMVMPAYGHVSVDERRLLARWLLAR